MHTVTHVTTDAVLLGTYHDIVAMHIHVCANN